MREDIFCKLIKKCKENKEETLKEETEYLNFLIDSPC